MVYTWRHRGVGVVVRPARNSDGYEEVRAEARQILRGQVRAVPAHVVHRVTERSLRACLKHNNVKSSVVSGTEGAQVSRGPGVQGMQERSSVEPML